MSLNKTSALSDFHLISAEVRENFFFFYFPSSIPHLSGVEIIIMLRYQVCASLHVSLKEASLKSSGLHLTTGL